MASEVVVLKLGGSIVTDKQKEFTASRETIARAMGEIYGPVSSAIVASKMLQGLSARLLCYQTSGDITEDYSQVVGYMTAIISK